MDDSLTGDPVTSATGRPPRLVPQPGSLGGLRVAQIGAWAPATAGMGYGLAHPGPAGSALIAGAGVVFLSTVLSWGHRWGYQWLGIAWARRRRPVPGELVLPEPPDPGIAALRHAFLPELRIRSAGPANARIGVIEDGSSWAAVVAVESAGQSAELLSGILAPVLHGDDIALAAVQVLVHTVPNPGDGLPRTELIRIALRLDPRTAGPGTEKLGAPSFQRTLRLRARQATELLAGHGRQARVMDAAEARNALLDDAALVPAEPADGRQLWRSWVSDGLRHTVFWLHRWPASGMASLQDVLSALPAAATVLTVTLTPTRSGGFQSTTLVRVISTRDVTSATLKAARRRGARLVPLHGEHHQGVLATLPLGREVETSVSWRPRHDSAPALRDSGHGLALGTSADGVPVMLPLFQPVPTRIALLADAPVAVLFALRAANSGASVRVVTTRPEQWPTVVECVPPGTGPVEGTSLTPWLVMDDGTGAADSTAPWCSSIDLLTESAAVGGYDTVLVHRPSSAVIDVLNRMFELPAGSAHGLRMMPQYAIALVRKGSVHLVDLTPSADEMALLSPDSQHV